ncbi:MAG: 1-deoxy-D-xylulose-5-phosphate reductoisomerase, partial [Pseudomonadota bacterium]
IEACWLFSLHYSQLEVVVHPQSVIHSMVEFTDGTTLAHLSAPTMNVPLAHALGWPNRLTTSVSSIDLIKVGQLTFEALDEDLFPALGLARWAQNQGGTACVTLNAANEEAVAAFLAGKLNFLQIYSVIEDALVHVPVIQDQSMDNILGTDGLARRRARTHIQLLNTTVCV